MKAKKKLLTKKKFTLLEKTGSGVPSGNITYILSFVIPLTIILILYIFRHISPFGDRFYLRSDMYHQYAPFFSELWHKIRNGESLFYTWDNGMGTNFISLMAYYLASPSNWFLAFIPQKNVPEFMDALIAIKLSGASLSLSYYISKHFNTKKVTIALFGMFYALSGYVAAYSWNIMWLDCIILLPLIMLGLERLVKENKVFLYCISLGLCIFTNYYIAIMVCLSVIIYFVVLIISYDGPKNPIFYIKKIFNWGFYSLISGGLAGCMLLPAIYTLSLSASSSVSFPKKLTAYFSILEMMVRQLINVEVHLGLEHHPNMYAGVAVFLLIPLYIMCKKINSREKIGKCVILLIFILSFNLNILNFIWHGFHFPNSLPCRQAFIYIFFLLTMSFEALQHIKSYNKRQFTTAVWIPLLLMVFYDYIFKDSKDYKFTIFYISAAFILIYALLMHLRRTKGLKTIVVLCATFVFAIMECSINMNATGFSTTGKTSYLLDFDAVKTVTNTVYTDDPSFYRMDKIIGARTKNDGSWHNYHSISTFSSTSNGEVSKFFKNFGMVGTTNAYSYDGSTMVTNSLFNVKYLISNQHLVTDSLRNYYTGNNGEFIYKNEYTLPLGYMVPTEFAKEWNYVTVNNGIQNQNYIVRAAAGINDIFEQMYSFSAYSEISFTATKSGHMYISIPSGYHNNETLSISINGEPKKFSNLKYNPHTLDLGYIEKGQVIEFIEPDNAVTCEVYTLNEDKFIQMYETLSEGGFNITEWTDTHFEGTVNAKKDGALFLSIPYDGGWSVYVDGVKADVYTVANTFMAVDVTAGEHRIELKYTPVNFILGCILTLLCIIILIAIHILKRRIAEGDIKTNKLPLFLQYLIDEDDKILKDPASEPKFKSSKNKDSDAKEKKKIQEITDDIEDMDDFDNIELDNNSDDNEHHSDNADNED